MKKLLFSWIVRHYLADFSVTERQMSDGEYTSAMFQLTQSPQLTKYLNILVGNMIRRHLYIKNMNEGSWYLGGIAAIRKLQADGDRFKQKLEREEPNIEIS